MIRENKYVLAIILIWAHFFAFFTGFGQNLYSGERVVDTVFLSGEGAKEGDTFDTILIPKVEIGDSVLVSILYEILQKEKNCPYYDNVTSISVDIFGNSNFDSRYSIRISLWDTDLLAWAKPLVFFTIDNHIGFFFGDKLVLNSTALFLETGNKTLFICNRSALYMRVSNV